MIEVTEANIEILEFHQVTFYFYLGDYRDGIKITMQPGYRIANLGLADTKKLRDALNNAFPCDT
jgi:hypothetical protein